MPSGISIFIQSLQTGFSVDNGVRIARDDQKGQTAVAQISEQSETSVYPQKSFFGRENHLY
jgi:hypothetical protein